MKFRVLLAIAVALSSALVQPVWAGGGHHHSVRGGGWGWAPFVAGAVVGGLAINAWAQTRPVYPAPVYRVPPPPPRVIVAQPYYVLPPVYTVPSPPPGYYYERD